MEWISPKRIRATQTQTQTNPCPTTKLPDWLKDAMEKQTRKDTNRYSIWISSPSTFTYLRQHPVLITKAIHPDYTLYIYRDINKEKLEQIVSEKKGLLIKQNSCTHMTANTSTRCHVCGITISTVRIKSKEHLLRTYNKIKSAEIKYYMDTYVRNAYALIPSVEK